MHEDLYEVNRLYVSRKEGRRLASIQDSIDAPIQRLENYMKKRGGRLMTATRNNTDNTNNCRTKITRKKIGRKTTVWTFQATNKRNLRRENVDMTKKGKL